jgi:hypothetical protein
MVLSSNYEASHYVMFFILHLFPPSTPCSQTSSLCPNACSSLRIAHKVSHPYKTMTKSGTQFVYCNLQVFGRMETQKNMN